MPITTVIPSLDGPALAALAAMTAPMGLADVHTRSGRGSKSGVRSVLLRMVEEGLVLEVHGGYVLNRDHVAAPAVMLLASLHGELANRIRAVVEEGRFPRSWSACSVRRPAADGRGTARRSSAGHPPTWHDWCGPRSRSCPSGLGISS